MSSSQPRAAGVHGPPGLFGGRPTPSDNDPALQPEAVLIVVKGADGQRTIIAKAGVEVFRLDEPQGEFLVEFDVKSPTDRHSEGGFRNAWLGRADRGVSALDADPHPAEVEFGKGLEGARTPEGKPGAEQKGEAGAAKILANRSGNGLAKVFAATQVRRHSDHTCKVIGQRTPATGTVKALAYVRTPRCVERNRGTDIHEGWRGFNLREFLSRSDAGR